MQIKDALDSTFLATTETSNFSEEQIKEKVETLIQEAIAHEMRAVMVRPRYVALSRERVKQAQAKTLVGTVIDFPNGQGGLQAKLDEAKQAVADGADELDFVCPYTALKSGKLQEVEEEITVCTRYVLEAGKTIKWIIETAALTSEEIVLITQLIRKIVESEFPGQAEKVFVKTSTGFFTTPEGVPNGATPEVIQLILSHSGDLPVKASGGVRTQAQAQAYLELGVQRIGTSSSLTLLGKD